MKWSDPKNQRFIEALLLLETPEEVRRFLRDLMTESEVEEFAKRFQAALLLTDNTPYSVIQKETGLSSTTIARVSKWRKGTLGGYRLIIDRMHHSGAIPRGRGLR